MGKMSRTKGRGYEQEIARALREELGVPAERVLQQWRDGGGGDVTAKDWPWLIECKRPAKFGGHKYMDQVIPDATKAGKAPVVCVRGDHAETLVMLRWADFVALMRRADAVALPTSTP